MEFIVDILRLDTHAGHMMGQLSSIEQDKLLHPVFCQKIFSYFDLDKQLHALLN